MTWCIECAVVNRLGQIVADSIDDALWDEVSNCVVLFGDV